MMAGVTHCPGTQAGSPGTSQGADDVIKLVIVESQLTIDVVGVDFAINHKIRLQENVASQTPMRRFVRIPVMTSLLLIV